MLHSCIACLYSENAVVENSVQRKSCVIAQGRWVFLVGMVDSVHHFPDGQVEFGG